MAFHLWQIGAFALAGISLIIGGCCIVANELRKLREGIRPVEPRDDMLGDFPNVPRVFHFGTDSTEA